jgi:hypothetical protein
MSNPLRMIDPNGMRTYFVDQDGNHIYTSNDKEEDAITIVNDPFFCDYLKWIWDGENVNDLRSFGISYLLDEIQNFDNLSNPTATDEEGSRNQRYGLTDKSLSNPLGTAFAELGANLYVLPGQQNVVHIGKAFSDGDYKQVWDRDPSDPTAAIPLNAIKVGRIHDHPNWKFRLAMGGVEPSNDYLNDAGPSGNSAFDADRAHSRTAPYYNIVLDKGSIYFYGRTGGYSSGVPISESKIVVPLKPFNR